MLDEMRRSFSLVDFMLLIRLIRICIMHTDINRGVEGAMSFDRTIRVQWRDPCADELPVFLKDGCVSLSVLPQLIRQHGATLPMHSCCIVWLHRLRLLNHCAHSTITRGSVLLCKYTRRGLRSRCMHSTTRHY